MRSHRFAVSLAFILLLAGFALADNPAPGAPQSLAVTDVAGDSGTALRVAFNASADDGAGADDVIRYRVYKRLTSGTGLGTCAYTITATNAASYACTLGGLTAGVSYHISVVAYDGVSESSAVAADATPVNNNPPPGTPQSLAVTDVAGDAGTALRVAFNASADDGAGADDVNRYRIYKRLGTETTDPTCIAVITATNAASYAYTITGLKRNTTYTIFVDAFDGTSASTRVSANGVPLDNLAPGPPRNLAVTDVAADAGTALNVTFQPSSDDGTGADDVNRYRVYKRLGTDTTAPTCIAVITATNASSYSYTVTGLKRNTTYTIFVEAFDGVYTSTRVSANGTPVDNLAPGAPRNVTVSDVAGDAGTALQLAFQASSDDGTGADDVNRYRVYKRLGTDTTDPTCIAVITATNAPSYSYTITGLKRNTTYTIFVEAFDGVFTSTRVSANGVPLDNLAPGPPRNLAVTDAPSDAGTALNVTFQASSDDGTGADDVNRYRVYKRLGTDTAEPTCIAVITATNASNYSYTVTGLTRNVTYTIFVEAFDGVFTSTRVSANGVPLDNLAPGPARNLAVTDAPADAGTALNVTFQPSSDDGTGADDVVRYRLYKRLASDTAEPTCIAVITATNAASYSYTVGGLTRNATYTIFVEAFDGVYASARVSANGTPVDNVAPGPPQNVAVADAPNDAGTALVLTFNASADDGAGADDVNRYRVYRRLGTDTAEPTCVAVITATNAASYSYTVGGLTRNLVYTISVEAYDGTFTSTRVSVNGTPLDNLAPGAPRNVRVADVPNDDGGVLRVAFDNSLDDGSGAKDVTRYRIYRRPTSSTADPICAAVITATGAGSYVYDLTGLTNGVSYNVTVAAYDGAFESARVGGDATPLDNTLPAPATGLAVVDWPNDDGTALRVSFNASTDDTSADREVSRYDIYQAPDATSAGSKVAEVTATRSATYATKCAGLTPLQTYYFWVIAVAPTGSSAPTGRVSGVPTDNIAPDPPRNVVVADVPGDAGTALIVTFDASLDDGANARDVTRYRVYKRLASDTADPTCVAVITATGAASYSSTVGGLTRGTSYSISVAAFDGTYESIRVGANGTPLDNLPPGVPRNVVVADTPGDTGTSLTLTFDASADDGAGANDVSRYRVYKRLASDTADPVCVAVITATDAASYAYTIGSLTRGTAYNITVAAFDGAYESARVGGNATPVDNMPPGAPQSVALADVAGDDGVALRLTFNASADDGKGINDVTKYFVYKSVTGVVATADASDPTYIGEITATKSASYAYTVTGLTAGTSYNISVSAYDGQYESTRASAIGVPVDNTPPAAPTGVVVEDWPSDAGTSLKVSFAASTDDTAADPEVTQYTVFWATSTTGAGTFGATVVATRAARYEAQVSGLTAGQTYYCWAVAIGATGTSAPSARVAGVPVDNRPVLPPSGLTAVDHPYDTGKVIDLTWTRSSDDGIGRDHVASYRIYRCMANVSQTPSVVGTVTATNAASYSWSDTTVPIDLVLYEYTITAVSNGGQESEACTAAQCASENNNVLAFDPPTSFTVADVAADSGGQLLLTWYRSDSEDEVGPPPPPPSFSTSTVTTEGGYGGQYDIYRRTGTTAYTAAPTIIVSAAGTTDPMTYVDSGLTNGTRYYYKMRYRRYNQISGFTAEVSAIPVNNTSSSSSASPSSTDVESSSLSTAAATLSVQLSDTPGTALVGQDLVLSADVTGTGGSSVYLQYSINGAPAARTAAVTGQGSYQAQLKLRIGSLPPGSTIRVRAVAVSGQETATSPIATIATASP
ncbi:fibronectin type III domain-containing protein [bacterium]|nr:fibronectin type III domain-containing protein [bacterium]